MKPNVNHRKFRNFFISKEIQGPIAIIHLAYLILVTAVLIATILSPFYTDIFHIDNLSAKHFSATMFILLLERLTVASIVVMIISFLHFIVFTHKFCGPMVSIRKAIARISKRDSSNIKKRWMVLKDQSW